jgi:hypothetical protein
MAVQKVAIAIHEGVQALDIAGPVDVFAETNGFVADGDGYETVLVGAQPRTAARVERHEDIGRSAL